MAKVEIVGVKSLFFDVLETIQDTGLLHLEDITKKKGPRYATLIPMEMDPGLEDERNRLQNLMMRNNALLAELTPPDVGVSRKQIQEVYKGYSGKSLDYISSLVEEEEAELKSLINRKLELEMELSRLSKYEPIIKKIYPLASKVTASEHYTSVALMVEKKYAGVLDYIKDEVEKITNHQCEVHSSRVDEDTFAAIVVFNKMYSEQVHNFLAAENVNQVRLPAEMAEKPYDEALQELERKYKEIPPLLEEVKKQIDELSDKWYAQLVALKDFIADRLSSLDAIPKFGQSGHVFVITGWMPSDQVDELRDLLDKKYEGKVEVTEQVPTHEELEHAPVAMRNNPVVKPFEFIYALIKPPRYGALDPTFLVAIFFPILFGFMLGDMGYGLVLIGLVFLIKRVLKKRGTEKSIIGLFANVLLISSISTIFFGLLYFEFFGDLLFRWIWGGYHLVWKWGVTSSGKPWGWPIERVASENRDIFMLLLLAVFFIGVLQMTTGLVIGVIDGIREKDRKHIIEKLGYLFFVWGLVLAFFFIWGVKFQPGTAVGAVLAVVGIGMAGYGGGFGGGMEAALTFGNILSYARLYGIALASVILAEVSNDLGAKFSGAFIPIGIIVAAALHTLNIALGVLSPSIQSLRLNLVETMTKFYQEAEEVYEPFKKAGGE
jgi:V/A-type H+-transporting ATPase subunit I